MTLRLLYLIFVRLGGGWCSCAAVARAATGRVVLVIAQAGGHLTFQGRLQLLPQHPALTGQLQPTGAGRLTNWSTSCSSRPSSAVSRVSGVRSSACSTPHIISVQVRILDQELHRSIYSPSLTMVPSLADGSFAEAEGHG